MNQIKDLAGEADAANAPEVAEEAKDDPNAQHFKYLLLQCDPANEGVIGKFIGGVCEVQDGKRKILLRCTLKAKGNVVEGKELRFETDEKPPIDAPETISRVDELVVMDSCAFLLQNGKEYVFKRGSFFADHGKETTKEYD